MTTAIKEKAGTVEWFDDRWYKIERKNQPTDYYPSVTTKLGVVAKDFLAKWRGDIGNREADMRLFEAQERGKRIHSGWETLCKGGAVVFNPPMRPNFDEAQLAALSNEHTFIEVVRHQEEMYQMTKLQRFLDEVRPGILGSEVMTYSDTYREAGTIDNVFQIEEGEYLVNGRTPLFLMGGVYIGDLKTGSMFDDNAYMQMAAYANAYEERTGVRPIGSLGIHTGAKTKTGIPGLAVYVRTREELDQDFKDFRSASAIWERKHKDDRPETFDLPTVLHMKGASKNEAA